ncbi:MAG TPA: DUF192 domain-containing protein [Woeseiaceae bacterium]|nr:DUF192 domain-containing protein [Woeseiaceae bacterium]
MSWRSAVLLACVSLALATSNVSAAGLGETSADASTELDARFARDVLIIEASQHACYLFDIYLAEEDAQQRRGLMFVRKLSPFTGMLFVYEDEQVHAMWMKNTYIPLDIAFIRSDGSVANIAEDTEPQSLKTIPAVEPVSYVLELNAGTAQRLHIDENSRVLWGPVFAR